MSIDQLEMVLGMVSAAGEGAFALAIVYLIVPVVGWGISGGVILALAYKGAAVLKEYRDANTEDYCAAVSVRRILTLLGHRGHNLILTKEDCEDVVTEVEELINQKEEK